MLARMCTIIAAVGVWTGRPLVVAANRDEALDRPASEPRAWAAGEVADRAVLAARDLQAGGTWLGINDVGLFVGITNRRAVPDPRRRSRGALVFAALGASHHAEARARIAALNAGDYNPFHLLFADREGASAIWSDGEVLHEVELGPGLHFITERSFDAAPSGRHSILTTASARLRVAGSAPDVDGWRSILAAHPPELGEGPPEARAILLDGVCVHAQPLNYGTRSSTVVELGPARTQLRYFHGAGRPCRVPLIEQRDAVAELLGMGDQPANSAPSDPFRDDHPSAT